MDSCDASTGRLLIGPLSFAVSPDERARLTTISTFDGTRDHVRLPNIAMGVVTLANGFIQTLVGVGALRSHTDSGSIPLIVGLASLIIAPFYLFGLVRKRQTFGRSRLSGDRERRFVMYERCVAFDRPGSLVPWSRVRSILDVGDAFLVQTILRRRLLPKRIFDDCGEAFWTYAASQIVSTGRMLVVPANRRMLRNSVSP